MAASHVLGINWNGGGISLSKSITSSATGEVNINAESIATAETDYEIIWACDVSALTSLYIVSTQDVTFETNDGVAPDNTIALRADEPYIWHTNSYDSCLLTVDVTSIFITNASGATATLDIRSLQDATP